MASGSLWNYHRDEMNDAANGNNAEVELIISECRFVNPVYL